ncbi:MAG TPA: hypothetical protein VFT54_07420, partial [Acidimicrobiia bacterium]|nr:hypothetical protein [Acidimicrobiia bacterium]
MKRRWLGVAIALLALPLFVLPTDSELGSPLVVDILGLIAFASPALVGAYLVWRLPENAVGWFLAGFGLTFTLGVIGETNAVINSPLATWGAWLGAWLWAMSMTLIIILLPLRFPDGRLPSPRYRWVTPVAAVGCLLVIFGNAFRASIAFPTDDGEVVVDLPLHLPLPTAVFDVAAGFGLILMLAAVGGAVLATIGRFRRSAGIERQQMKVFAGALAFSVTGMALNLVLYEVGNVSWANGVFALLVLVLVSSIALSVLRYRLYDFDRLVSRTVSYALVAGVLAAVYGFGAVWLPSQIV